MKPRLIHGVTQTLGAVKYIRTFNIIESKYHNIVEEFLGIDGDEGRRKALNVLEDYVLIISKSIQFSSLEKSATRD